MEEKKKCKCQEINQFHLINRSLDLDDDEGKVSGWVTDISECKECGKKWKTLYKIEGEEFSRFEYSEVLKTQHGHDCELRIDTKEGIVKNTFDYNLDTYADLYFTKGLQNLLIHNVLERCQTDMDKNVPIDLARYMNECWSGIITDLEMITKTEAGRILRKALKE